MFVADALGNSGSEPMKVDFIDNTDPDGIARRLAGPAARLHETLCIVTSKSGGTPDTRNGMLLVDEAFRREKLDFSKRAVAITLPGSQMDQTAAAQGWLARFPMFDWVGGRTSVLSAVGLVPAALQGFEIDGLLAGAAACDAATRNHDLRSNPAALTALMWYHATGGKGKKDMVVLPYKDRLLLFSRYLQQLVMESLGKRLNLKGERVDQGIAVYGNKGSTDQHAYVQQLRDGVNISAFTAAVNFAAPAPADAGVTHLKEMKGLIHVDLNKTQLTDAGLKELKEALPNCQVTR
jgi:glucose-6-phosphate isomerase